VPVLPTGPPPPVMRGIPPRISIAGRLAGRVGGCQVGAVGVWNTKFDKAGWGWEQSLQYGELFHGPPRRRAANDYLRLSTHPGLRAEALKAVAGLPVGSRGSRLLGGNVPCFEELESSIAAFFEAPAALFFSSGYLANLAVTGAVAAFADHVFS